MSGPTKGPWIAVEVGDSGGENPIGVYEVRTADGHVRVAEFLHEADARLIAQSPALAEALQALITSLADADEEGLIEHADQMVAARAALAAAGVDK